MKRKKETNLFDNSGFIFCESKTLPECNCADFAKKVYIRMFFLGIKKLFHFKKKPNSSGNSSFPSSSSLSSSSFSSFSSSPSSSLGLLSSCSSTDKWDFGFDS